MSVADHTMADAQAAQDRGTRRLRLGSLFAGIALLVVGNGLQGTLIGVRAGIEGMPTGAIGLVMSSFFAGFAIASVFAPRLVQAVGHIRTFAALASTASAVTLMFVFAISPAAWIVLRTVQGACYAGMIIVVESWLNATATRARRGRVLATYMVIVYAGWAASQPLLDLAAPEGFALFALVSIFLSLALVPITLSRAGVPGVVLATRFSFRRLYAVSPLALVGAFMMGFAVSAFFGMGPAFAQEIGLAEADIGIFIAAMLLGALASQWPMGWLSDVISRRSVIIGAAATAAAVALFIALNRAEAPALFVLSALLGAATMPVYSVCVAHTNDYLEESELVAAASGLILVYGAGSAFGPFTASLVMSWTGHYGLFLFMAGVLGSFALYGVYRVTRRSAVAPDEKTGFEPAPQTAHPVLRLRREGPKADPEPRAPQ